MTYYKKQGRKYVECKPFQGMDIEIIIMSAARYAFGRMTYVPSAFMDFCKEHWPQLSQKTRNIVMRDTLEWLGGRHNWKTEVQVTDYAKEWTEFLRWCYAQSKDDAAWCRAACAQTRRYMKNVDEFFEVNQCTPKTQNQ